MAIKLKSAKTTAAGLGSIFTTLSGIAVAFTQIPQDDLTNTQLISFGAIALATIINSVGNIFAPDSTEVSAVMTELNTNKLSVPAKR